jgi:hypothetical protein
MTTHNPRAHRWTLARRITDRLPRIMPGKHHPVWSAS